MLICITTPIIGRYPIADPIISATLVEMFGLEVHSDLCSKCDEEYI